MLRMLQRWWRRLTERRTRAEATAEEDAAQLAGDASAPSVSERDPPAVVEEPARHAATEPEREVTVPVQRTSGRREDDLTVIKGIGPATQRRLKVAGIRSYDDLAGATPEEIHRALIGSRRGAKVEQWIRRARQLSNQRDDITP